MVVLVETNLNETSRNDLLVKSRQGSKTRFKKRLNYQVSNFKGVDLSNLFNNDYFVFNTPINHYVCTIAYPKVMSEIKEVVKITKGNPQKINLQMIIKALRRSFDKTDDIKVRCTCSDFRYRFMYWSYKNGYLYGPPDPGTDEFPKVTNPDDALGATCKHLDLFLSNKRWLTKAASCINSLIKTYPDKASVYLYDEQYLDDQKDDTEKEEDEKGINKEIINQENSEDSNIEENNPEESSDEAEESS